MSAAETRQVGVITGATSGIGRAAAGLLGAGGYDLALLGRNRNRGEAVRARLARTHPSGHFEFISCDLASMASARGAAMEIRARFGRIDLLINNAGTRIDRYQESADGFERTFATNHLGHFLLTCLVLDRLQAGSPARVVTVSSRKHREVRRIDGWLAARDAYDRWDAYARSKLANVLFAFELSRRMESSRIVSNVVDPGIVASNFARNNGLVPWAKHIASSLIARQLVSSRRAARLVFHAAESVDTGLVTGRYFIGTNQTAPSALALDTDLAADLWTRSVKWCELDRRECPAWDVVEPRRGVST
jgi:NAD(P)-dependent dehydrogenase (short-subunit alcohol dehydrogenase family)